VNQLGFPILSLMLAIPPVLAAAIAACSSQQRRALDLALGATLANLALGILLWLSYDIGGRSGSSSNSAGLRPLRLGARHRRHRADADHAVGVPDADLHRWPAGRRSSTASRNIWPPSC
jgi:hypothetical protein